MINQFRIIEKIGLIFFLIGMGIRLTDGTGYTAEVLMLLGMFTYLSFNNRSTKKNGN